MENFLKILWFGKGHWRNAPSISEVEAAMDKQLLASQKKQEQAKEQAEKLDFERKLESISKKVSCQGFTNLWINAPESLEFLKGVSVGYAHPHLDVVNRFRSFERHYEELKTFVDYLQYNAANVKVVYGPPSEVPTMGGRGHVKIRRESKEITLSPEHLSLHRGDFYIRDFDFLTTCAIDCERFSSYTTRNDTEAEMKKILKGVNVYA